jgi:hypothetical protein
MAEEIYIVKDRITPANEVTIKQLIEENIKLRADVERIGRERNDMARANAELQPLASIANEVIAYRRRVGPLGFQLEKLDDYLSKAGLPLDAPNNEQAHK